VLGWFGALPPTAPTIGGFLYVTLVAIAAGLVVSTVRWMILDTIHALTGLRRPHFNYAELAAKVEGYDVLVRHHYEYYKFHGNLLIAVLFSWVSRRFSLGFFRAPLGWIDLGVFLLAVVLAMGSRDTLRNYYERLAMLLGDLRQESSRRTSSKATARSKSKKGAKHLTIDAESVR
jgi:hypothetical protein